MIPVNTADKTLKILHAGALRKPMKETVHLFRERYPDVRVSLDYAGSRACAHAVLEGLDADVIALADPHVFEDLLVPEHVDIFFVFATDRIVLAYDEFSRYSGIISRDNWFDILARDGVLFARSDHNLDPCGYRTLMVWQMAEKYYGRPGLFNMLNQKCGHNVIYPKSIDSSEALLEGRVDYVFAYSSVAEQFSFFYVNLPDSINLSNPAYADEYARVSVTVSGKGGGVTLVRGTPIEFAVAVPKKSSNRELAGQFIKTLTSPEGEKILESCGLVPC
ncbi:MAG: extracellular solute-binding protein [Bacillota bacterium]